MPLKVYLTRTANIGEPNAGWDYMNLSGTLTRQFAYGENGSTWGWSSYGEQDSRARSSSFDRSISGIHWAVNQNPELWFDLPSGAGTYDVAVGSADTFGGGVSSNWNLRDGTDTGTILHTTNHSSSAGNAIDIAGNETAFASFDPDTQATVQLTFATSRLVMNTSTTGSQFISNVIITEAGAPPAAGTYRPFESNTFKQYHIG